MTWRITHIYPFLFAIIPVVRLVVENPGWMEVDDAAVVVAAVLAGCGVVYGLALLATRRRGGRLPPPILLGVVLAFWIYVRVAAFVEHRSSLSHPVLFPLWVAATVGAIWWLVRRPALLDRVERFLTLTSGMLVAWFVVSIGVAQFRSARAVRESAVVLRLTEPIRSRPGATIGPKRDIYLIVLDEYANAEVTRRLFGFDNHVFLDSLRQLGFVVPAVHSNYCHTFLSVPSMLSASHVVGLSGELGRMSVDRTVADYLVRHNRTVPFLKSQGYQYALFPTLGWEATKHDPRADREFQAGHGSAPAREVSRSGLRNVLYRTSLLKFVDLGTGRFDRDQVTGTLTGIAQIPRMPGPVFTFAHLMSPHDPYVFARDCGPARHQAGGSRSQREAAAYVEQIQCLNRKVLDLVTTLLRTSELPPVILLQGDHGSKTLLPYKDRSPDRITLAAGKERLGAFGAYYLPDHGSEVFGDSVTIVNVVGNVLRFYLGADLPREPDDMYLSVHRAPFAFKRVDFAWLAREDWSARPDSADASH
jgi:sulfatase-like protein